MKLPLKLNIPSEGDIGGSKDCYLINWLKELSESYNSTIDYMEQLEERIKDLEKNELY